MKTFLTILTFLPLFITAQTFSVKSFKSVPDDMTARVTDPVIDVNGEKCALIKVRTTLTGFVFEGDMLGIEKSIPKTAEIWVYVPNGAKKLTIMQQQLGVLEYLYTEKIKEATVYIMELTTAKVTTIIEEEEIKTSYIVVRTQPTGADVYIDETYMGTSPFTKRMTAGTYNYRVEMPMYNSLAGKVEITGDNPREELMLKMPPAFGYVKISTTPESDAIVTIDGEPVTGKTPVTSEKLKKGTHRATIKLPMYQPVTKEFEITEGETTDLWVQLQPSFATVNIITSPSSNIYIDAEKVGFGNYTGRVMEGFHSFSSSRDKYKDVKEQIELKAGQSETINLNLQAITGTLDIMTTPIDATIKLDGLDKGKTPGSLKGILIGNHTLTLEKLGYETIRKDITIEENKTTELNLTFTEFGKSVTPTQTVTQKPATQQNNTSTTQTQQPKTTTIKPGTQVEYTVKSNTPKVTYSNPGYKKAKNTFLFISVLSAGASGYFAYTADDLYKNEYPNATTDATTIHEDIEQLDLIWQASLGVSVGSLVTAIIFNHKYKKSKFRADIVPLKKGAGLNLAYRF